jgi:hypothetical protein
MLENRNEACDPAPEDARDRKQVQNQRDFEPLLDTECILEFFGRKRRGDQFLLFRLENVGGFAPPRSIVGWANSPVEQQHAEDNNTRSILAVSADTV